VPIPAKHARPWWDPLVRIRAAVDALDHVVGGLGTAVLAATALIAVLATAVLCLVGVGIPLTPATLRAVRSVADRERARLSRWGAEILTPPPVPGTFRACLADRAVRRELGWLVGHSVLGILLGLVALTLPVDTVHDVTLPIWWRFVSSNSATTAQAFYSVADSPRAIEEKVFTLVCSSMASGRLSPVRLNTQVSTMLKVTQVATNTTGVSGVTCGQPPHSDRNSGRCQIPHSGPRITVPPGGPKRRCNRGNAKSRQPGSSASPVVTSWSSNIGT